jgi:hypothetical protein
MIPDHTNAIRRAIVAQIAALPPTENRHAYDRGRLSAFCCLLEHAAIMPSTALLELCLAKAHLMDTRTRLPAFAGSAARWQGWADACAEVARIICTLTCDGHLGVEEDVETP